ncbi:LysM peptidoglycan-binding domain-containing protein, partial [Enterococcus gallinarum]|uniref:LysM peptidoglycan-binding domain-containing protein n=3 Tax=Enterococcus gallinarum TaxID=1353 RepID=UPI00391E0169
TTTPKNTMHQVRAGESVWSISHKYGISMNDFIKWNKIKNNLIHPGQQVIVKQPASTSKPAAKPSTPATYKVKAGDSVWGICEKYGLSVSKFVQWNKIKNNTIHPGQVMHLQEPKPASKPAPKTSPTTNTTYTVKTGDSVWLIANMHGISMNDLVNWNKIKNNTIHPGQKLTVKQPVSSGKPTTKVPASTNPVTHKVSYGESLWLISSKYGVTVDELRKQNGIKGDLIHPGQVLVVKKGTTTSHSTPAGKSGTSYTVKAGDSVWLIANRYGVSMDDLVKWNKIKNYTIHPGQVLTIQTIVSTPAKPAITTTPKVEAKPAITTTPKVESKPGVTTTPKVDEKPVITTIPKVKEQPVVTTVPKTESEVLVEKASGAEIVKYGEDFGKMGIYVEHPNIKVDWSKHSVHGLERLEQRGLSKQQVEDFIKDGKVLSQNNGEKFAFITEEGVAILNKQGKLVTAWGKNDFDKEMIDIIEKLFGK